MSGSSIPVYDLSVTHYHYTVTKPPYDREVVGDEKDRDMEIVAELFKELQDRYRGYRIQR